VFRFLPKEYTMKNVKHNWLWLILLALAFLGILLMIIVTTGNWRA
jgi:hypothetical protein